MFAHGASILAASRAIIVANASVITSGFNTSCAAMAAKRSSSAQNVSMESYRREGSLASPRSTTASSSCASSGGEASSDSGSRVTFATMSAL